ncbi:hypothetical protein PsYK624_064620 [Phanerochaete sordida]|uniref:Uncharacterized protein n=1 Tax=Phanerochaete sordida TaxID=48140 RepID=A0A9P3G941_9APHY|nr:hypothetical protein PsYK624_064620 [Phanerochaete sordida]
MKEELPLLILTHLDEQLSWGKQEVKKKRTFIQAVVARFPCLEHYEDAWPVLAYTPEWLSRRKGRVLSQHEARSLLPRRSHNAEDVSTSASRPSTRLAHGTRMPTRTSPQRQRQPSAEVPVQPSSPSPELMNGPSPTSAVRTTVSASVRRFLASLRPSMRELAMVFALAGVRDRACLEALVAMTHAEQSAFLDRLPLNMFQREVVLDGLAARRR